MKMFSWVPNFLTICNLLCGVMAIFSIFYGDFTLAFWLIICGAIFDFFDGFAARMLRAYSEIGKQLDSLSDMVSFGVAPSVLVVHLLGGWLVQLGYPSVISYLGLSLAAFGALRLAKFNVDTRQSDQFIGIPTPAMSLFFFSYAMTILSCQEISPLTGLLLTGGLVVLFSALMVCEIPFFSFKFRSFGFGANALRYIFALGSLVAIILGGYSSLAIIISAYIVISLVQRVVCSKK
ncbi:MAG: CDP-diacylglycerol--serine O-phosphatidyltransferase [Rikenellaceae bacterium]